ncbi:MAG: glycosyltransferase [Candidatus Binatia bacterium]
MDSRTMSPGAVLEIGHAPFLARCRPDVARFVAVGARSPAHEATLVVEGPAAPLRLPALARMLDDPALRLVACRIHQRPGIAWRTVATLLRRACRVPIVLLDFEDEDVLHPAHRRLAVRAQRIFKRELPVDRWRLARGTVSRASDDARLRRDPDARAIVAALRPLPLGLPFGATPPSSTTKAADVFFAGEIASRAGARAAAAAELRALAAEGIAIDMPDERLPREEFHRRLARSRLAWSPAGLGWHCFRHAEAAAAGSVPLMPRPTVETAAGFVHGETALFYDTRPGGLASAVREALADPPRLARIAAAARAHALANLTPEAVAARVLAESLGG